MRIKKFYMPQMHNGEHVEFHVESHEQLNQENPAALGISEQAGTYGNAINEEKQSIAVFSASELSSESLKLDQVRGKAYSAFKAWLKVYANDTYSSLSEAAERLLFVVRKSAIDAGDPLSLGLTQETSAINSLLQSLEPLRPDIDLIGATNKLYALEAANRAFEKLQIERNIEKAGKRSGNVQEFRAVTDTAYNAIVERINAQALLQGSGAFESFIRKQNAVIDKYSNLVAQRKGRTKT
jgi:hypothetical protein